MMRSMYSGVSGLKTHQTKMDVIGNNIANVNTVAYKSQSITFSELMYQTTQKSSGPNELTGTGGTNARQIGLGVQSAAINTAITTQGATQTTGNPYDLCITGNSFFIVSDGSQNYFTRAGAFNIDSVGNLVMTSNGYNVMGWGVDEETMTIKQDTVSALRIMSADNMTYPPEATSNAYVSGIIDKNDSDVGTEAGKALNLSFYDNLGYSYTAKFSIHSTTDDGAYYVELDDVIDSNGKSITEMYPGSNLSDLVSINTDATYTANVNVPYTKLDTVTFEGGTFKNTSTGDDIANMTAFGSTDADGNITVTVPISDANITLLQQIYGSDADFSGIAAATIDATTGQLKVTQKSGAGVLLNYSTDDGSFMTIGGSQTGITIDFKAAVEGDGESAGTSLEQFEDISFDWTATNMYNNSGTSTIGATSGDKDGVGTGRKLGNMTGVTIQTNGMIYASYDNGMTRLMGQIAVAEFSNAAGLEKSGDNLYSASLNSGEFDGVGVDITGSGGYMTTGVLEMSNVDLSTEFTEMITTQRGFQANSRIITVSDTMLEELVNLKR